MGTSAKSKDSSTSSSVLSPTKLPIFKCMLCDEMYRSIRKGKEIRIESFRWEHRGDRIPDPGRTPQGHPCMCFFNIMTSFNSLEEIKQKGLVAIDTELARTLFL